MIASIHGELLSVGAGWVVISVGGIGMRVEVPTGRVAGAHVGETLFLHTNLIVREDSLTLFGFASADELAVFGYLLAVSGVGPRSALGVLAEMTPVQIARAVQSEDDKPFRKVSGIGPKTAKLIAVSLAGKLRPEQFAAATGRSDSGDADIVVSAEAAVAARVEQALIGLGYAEAQAEAVVNDALAAGAEIGDAALLRSALALLQAPTASARARGGIA